MPRKRVPPIPALLDETRAHIVDVSYDGLRVLVANTVPTLPRAFTVHIPTRQLALSAHWVWTSAITSRQTDVAWYGVKLTTLNPDVSVAWRRLVDSTAGVIVNTV